MASTMSIKWCKKNLQHHSQAVHDALQEEFPDVEMEVVDCVDHCGLCTDVPFAMRNNAVIGGRDARGLYMKMKQGMQFMSKPPLPGTYAAVMASARANESETDTES